MSSRKKIILIAHLIKFGVPFGLIMVVSNLIYAGLFRVEGIDTEIVGKSALIFGMSLLGSLVLGLSRASRENV